MTTGTIAHPPIVSQAEWLDARKALLAHEKEITRARDALNAARRRLPDLHPVRGFPRRYQPLG